MATLSDVQIKITNSATPGTSDVKVSYLVNFDGYDRAVNQSYHAHADIMGDDTNMPGDNEVPPKDDLLWAWGMGEVRASDAPPFPPFLLAKSLVIKVPTHVLNEDAGTDEIRAVVSLNPTPVFIPKKVIKESADYVKLTL